MVRSLRYISLIFTILFFNNLSAQNVEQIKSDPAYWSAEGVGVTIDEADKDALAKISRQISVSISTSSSMSDNSVRSSDGSTNYEKTQGNSTTAFSFASLQNVKMMIIQPEPNAKVFRWVAKEEVDKMFAERGKKIKDFVSIGKIAEQNLQIDDALRNYYWALMLAKSNRDAVYAEFNGEEVNCVTYLPMKIKSVLSHIKVSVGECESKDGRYYVQTHFTYNDNNVSSLQLRYFDGQSYVGPLTVRDGVGELELVSLPANEKIQIGYEYSFRKEAENMALDGELVSVFKSTTPPIIDNSFVEIPVKVNSKKQTIKANKESQIGVSAPMTAGVELVETEEVKVRERKELVSVENEKPYIEALKSVEESIRTGKTETAYKYFDVEGYKMFCALMKSGKISLVGNGQEYNFLKTNNQVLGRFCKVKIRHSNGRSFMENLTFRFNPETNKIQSLAFALTKKAEDDIFNAASSWTDISRFTILQFMEDYQTAYSLKRLDYIDKIFSDDAIIITGTVLKSVPKVQEGVAVDFGKDDIHYTKLNKSQFLERLKQQFKREYIHLTFEDNVTRVINAERLPPGTAFAIQIRQIYNSPVYSDRGYLTLILDASKDLPIIHVRLWQPEKKDMMSLDEFINKFEF